MSWSNRVDNCRVAGYQEVMGWEKGNERHLAIPPESQDTALGEAMDHDGSVSGFCPVGCE